jgi:hypothetical protein
MEASGESGRWIQVALLVLAGGVFITATTPLGHEGVDAGSHIAILAAVLTAGLVLAVGSRDPEWARNVARGFAAGLPIALVMYLWPPEIGGRGDFQVRSAVALAVITAVVLVQSRGRGGFYTRWLGGMLGIVLPPLLLMGLFVATCGTEGCVD